MVADAGANNGLMRHQAILAVFCAGSALVFAGNPATNVFGFTTRSSASQRRLEYRFQLLPSAARTRDAHAFLTADPHIAGSARD
ncbi:MAG TPA: hypothetical protein VHT95_07305, partial [Vicinamibacterales bacterium]|nr:hypothetical protein [Vicinamibacterales bacterium]